MALAVRFHSVSILTMVPSLPFVSTCPYSHRTQCTLSLMPIDSAMASRIALHELTLLSSSSNRRRHGMIVTTASTLLWRSCCSCVKRSNACAAVDLDFWLCDPATGYRCGFLRRNDSLTFVGSSFNGFLPRWRFGWVSYLNCFRRSNANTRLGDFGCLYALNLDAHF